MTMRYTATEIARTLGQDPPTDEQAAVIEAAAEEIAVIEAADEVVDEVVAGEELSDTVTTGAVTTEDGAHEV